MLVLVPMQPYDPSAQPKGGAQAGSGSAGAGPSGAGPSGGAAGPAGGYGDDDDEDEDEDDEDFDPGMLERCVGRGWGGTGVK